MDQIKMGKYICKKRQEQNLTQVQLADKLHVTDKAVSKWERGLSCPGVDLLIPLSDVLGVSVLNILSGEDGMPEDIKADEIVMDTAKTYVKHEKKVSRIAYCFLLLIIVLLLVFMPKGDEESSEYLAYELPEGLRYVSIPVEMQSETDNSVYRISINALVSDLPSGSEKILFTEIYNLDSGLPLVGNCDIKLFRHDEAEKIEVFVNGIVSDINYEPGLVNYSETYNAADGYITQIQFNGSEGSDGLLYNGKQQGGYVYYHGWHEFK